MLVTLIAVPISKGLSALWVEKTATIDYEDLRFHNQENPERDFTKYDYIERLMLMSLICFSADSISGYDSWGWGGSWWWIIIIFFIFYGFWFWRKGNNYTLPRHNPKSLSGGTRHHLTVSTFQRFCIGCLDY